MEFIAKIPDNLPEIIENNGEEVKAWLAEKMQRYESIVVTPETIRAAKDDKAALNKLRTALEERRKEVKRDYLAPYNRFEEQYKELLALIDAPIASIDKQVRAFDEQEQKEKYDRLQEFFMGCIARMPHPVSIQFDRILNPKWRNKTVKEEALQREIAGTVARIAADVEELDSYYADSPHYTAVMDTYMKSYDKGSALAYAAALVQQEARRKEVQQAHRAPEPAPPPVYEPEPEPPVQEPQALITGVFRVTGTKQQIIALRDFMRANQIEFTIVK